MTQQFSSTQTLRYVPRRAPAPLAPTAARVSSPLAIFTIPKPFRGHAGVIQRNALASWTRLQPHCEVFLCGDEAGVAEAAAEFGVRHLPDLDCNEFGTPYLRSAFERVRDASERELLCYVNADIMLLSDFVQAVAQIRLRPFIMIGQRWDVDVDWAWNFDHPDWERALREHVDRRGVQHSLWGIDYFVFPRVCKKIELPAEFVVGRPGWDNWMIFNARKSGIAVVDASDATRAIHQNHDYTHVPQRNGERWVGPEACRQVQQASALMGGSSTRFAIVDATHRVTDSGVVKKRGLRTMRRRWTTLPALFPRARYLVAALDPLMQCADGVWSLMKAGRRAERAS